MVMRARFALTGVVRSAQIFIRRLLGPREPGLREIVSDRTVVYRRASSKEHAPIGFREFEGVSPGDHFRNTRAARNYRKPIGPQFAREGLRELSLDLRPRLRAPALSCSIARRTR